MRHWQKYWLLSALLLYLALAAYQLGLPGLHYDEAKEAGVNAVELLTSAPVTAFRDATISIAGWRLPLMVQDYIGALNVYLALPFLKLTGIGVPNLRFLSLLTGAAALLLLERALSEYAYYCADLRANNSNRNRFPLPASHLSRPPISLAGLIAVTLLVASPSFLFWSRQGIFVTNLIQPLCFAALWQGIRWLRTDRPRALLASAFYAGLALYAKLLAIWIIAPFTLMAIGWWLWFRARRGLHRARLSPMLFGATVAAFLLPLLPLIAFNLQTSGTLRNLSQNLGQSYYGVDNLDLLQNALIRRQQLLDTLRGSHLWYLGGIFRNPLAPWLALVALVAGLLSNWRVLLPPLLLLTSAFLFSLFTITDLFITHYAVVQLLLVAVVGVAVEAVDQTFRRGVEQDSVTTTNQVSVRNLVCNSRVPRAAIVLGLLLWLALDLTASVRYHAALTQSGGLSDHSDASYDLAYHLRYNGMGAPIVLDWGMDAPVRYLSQGTVRPIEIFGYGSPAAPDADFAARLAPFLGNTENVYLLHAPGQTVFDGRREAFFRQAANTGLTPQLEAHFDQRDGTPLFELWRVSD